MIQLLYGHAAAVLVGGGQAHLSVGYGDLTVRGSNHLSQSFLRLIESALQRLDLPSRSATHILGKGMAWQLLT